MKQVIKKLSFLLLAAAFISPATLLAQKEDKDKGKDKKDAEQIIITRTGDKDEKIVVEVTGDKVLVNGKEIDKNDKDGNVSVVRTTVRNNWTTSSYPAKFDNFKVYADGMNTYSTTFDDNRPMLGVTTEKTDKGAEVQDVTKESGAEKAGLKEGDIITKIGDKKIEGPDDLSAEIKKHKTGDKVTVTYWRDKKEQTVTAELTKWKGVSGYAISPDQNFNFNLQGLNAMPRVRAPHILGGTQAWSWSGGGPRLGLSVQDSEDGKGVTVLEVDEDGNAAKAGIQEDDVITEVDGKEINSADEIAKVMKDSKEKSSVKVKLQRKGKTENVEVKIPKKLKTADL